MQTILYQGKPEECNSWVVLPEAFVPTVKHLRYDIRQLVTRADAEAAALAARNEGIEKAAALVETKSPALARMVRDLKMPALVKAG